VRDQVRDSQFYTPVHFGDERLDRLLVEFILRTRKIRKIRHMINHRTQTARRELLAETLHFLRI